MEQRNWTEADVLTILTNPVYAGFGPFPQVVPDAAFIEAGARLIKERGAAWYIQTMLAHRREALPGPAEGDSPPASKSTKRSGA